MKPKRSTPSSCSGFSLVELLVGMSVTLVVAGAAFSMALSTRSLYAADQTRMRLNQSLRAGRDFVTMDVQTMGERLGVAFPVVEIVDGASGAPDELIVRRNLLDTSLNVCLWDLSGSQTWIVTGLNPAIFTSPPPEPGCSQMPSSDNLMAWQAFRTANATENDGSSNNTDVRAYIWDPVNQVGEFFNYNSEMASSAADIVYAVAGTNWTNTYAAANGPQLYLLEERRYRLTGEVLELMINGGTTPVNLVDAISDFQLRALFKPDPPNPTPPAQTAFGVADSWTTLRAVEVTLSGQLANDDNFITGSWTSEIMPRNVLSR